MQGGPVRTRRLTMKKKTLKSMNPVLKWTFIAVLCFIVGFIIAQTMSSKPSHQQAAGGSSFFGGGSQPTEKIMENKNSGVMVIVGAIVIIAAIIGLGYFFDKRKK